MKRHHFSAYSSSFPLLESVANALAASTAEPTGRLPRPSYAFFFAFSMIG